MIAFALVCRHRVNAWLAARLEPSDGHFGGYVGAALQQTHCDYGCGKVGGSVSFNTEVSVWLVVGDEVSFNTTVGG